MAYAVSISVSQSYNATTNKSTVSVGLSFRGWANNDGTNYAWSGYTTSWAVSVNGTQVNSGAGPKNFNADSQGNVTSTDSGWVYMGGGSAEFDHGADGKRVAIGVSGTFYGSGGFSPPSTGISGSNTAGALDADRRPPTPSFTSGYPSRGGNSSGVTGIGVRFDGGVSPTGLTTTYYSQYSKDNGAYTGTLSSTSATGFAHTGLVKGSSYVIRGYTLNGDTTNSTDPVGYVTSGTISIPNVPGAPNPLQVTSPAGRKVTVTVGNATSGSVGTSTIAASSLVYKLQSSTDGGVTWKNNAGDVNGFDTMSGTDNAHAYEYTNMSGGSTYRFRVYATNEMGDGAITYQGSPYTFVPAGGKRYDATLPTPTFVNASTASRRHETNTSWVPLTITRKYVVSEVITNAVVSGGGTIITYTASNSFTANTINKVTVTGLPTGLNVTDALVTAATDTSFTVATTGASGTFSSSPSSKAAGWMDFI